MALLIYRTSLAVALGVCLVSFAWGMRRAFVLPRRTTLGMRVTALFGTMFSVLHFYVILTAPRFAASLMCAALTSYLLALGLFWSTVSASGKRRLPACFTNVQPAGIVTCGPYKFVRHPFYTSYLIAWAAGALATLNPWLITTFVLMSTIYVSAARKEEKALMNGVLSAEYVRYRSLTGMLFPRLLNR